MPPEVLSLTAGKLRMILRHCALEGTSRGGGNPGIACQWGYVVPLSCIARASCIAVMTDTSCIGCYDRHQLHCCYDYQLHCWVRGRVYLYVLVRTCACHHTFCPGAHACPVRLPSPRG